MNGLKTKEYSTWREPASKLRRDAKLPGKIVSEPYFTGSRPVALADSLYQLIVTSLEGPRGVQAESLIAAIGALAGYGARWVIRRDIAAGRLEPDFHIPVNVKRPGVVTSAHVDRLVFDMRADSFAAACVPGIIAAGSNWLPDLNRAVQSNFMAINSPTYPDYSIPARHYPEVPPQALLLMLWEKTQRCLRSTEDAERLAMASFGMAATRAVIANKVRVPMHIGGQLAIETAIAMSKVEYGF